MAFPRSYSHLIVQFMDAGFLESTAKELAYDCIPRDVLGNLIKSNGPNKAMIKAAIEKRKDQLRLLEAIDLDDEV